ncbi:MAG: hypothetical protein R3F14_37615 [Polyangiaceae bacterium]
MPAAGPRLSPSTILRYEKLEGVADRSLEDLSKMAAQLLDIERCFAGLVDPGSGWIRTVSGVGPSEARDYAPFCAYALLQKGRRSSMTRAQWRCCNTCRSWRRRTEYACLRRRRS